MISYTTGFMPNKIMIIGCGGTGSRLVPLLGQFLKTCAWIQNPEITLIDDDVVEEKNLLRQNFIAPDVGKPKAEILAQRYAKAFNVNILPKVARVTAIPDPYHPDTRKNAVEEQQWRDLFARYTNNAIIVMCVDSPEARRHIVTRILAARNAYQNSGSNFLLIDSGNENDFGQVTISMGARVLVAAGYTALLKDFPRSIPGDMSIPAIPMDITYFRDMKSETTASCADLDQTMAINAQMAITMFGIIQNLYYAKPISFYRINVSLQHGNTPEYINPAYLLRCMTTDLLKKGEFGNGCDLAIPYVDISSAIKECQTNVVGPHKRIMDKAASDQKVAEDKAKAKEKEKLEKAAIEAAMRFYGWTVPEVMKGTGPAAYMHSKDEKMNIGSLKESVAKAVATKKAETQAEKEMKEFLALGKDEKTVVKRVSRTNPENAIEAAYGFNDE